MEVFPVVVSKLANSCTATGAVCNSVLRTAKK